MVIKDFVKLNYLVTSTINTVNYTHNNVPDMFVIIMSGTNETTTAKSINKSNLTADVAAIKPLVANVFFVCNVNIS